MRKGQTFTEITPARIEEFLKNYPVKFNKHRLSPLGDPPALHGDIIYDYWLMDKNYNELLDTEVFSYRTKYGIVFVYTQWDGDHPIDYFNTGVKTMEHFKKRLDRAMKNLGEIQ